jgi:glycosyltransferase involved in cell wall biosynthesis
MTTLRPRPLPSSLKPPAIRALPADGSRPFWSVMIPTYNPRADYLEETLRSILQQEPGPAEMQIEVVDDCSEENTASEITRRAGAGRVTFHRESENRGLANSWNRCIERARGNWVHILHQDDIVLPGFYERLYERIINNSHVGMALCRFAIIDANGHWKTLAPLESVTPGVLPDWLERVATGYHVECPAVVVKRETYERLGGFNAELTSVLDVEMWVRIAAHAPVYYEPQILALFRRHGSNVSMIQERMGENMQDMATAIRIWKSYLPANSRQQLERQGRRYWADIALTLAQQFFSNDDVAACSSQLRAAKTLWDHGQHRSRRLRLEAKVGFYRALGRRGISAVRELRRRIRSAKLRNGPREDFRNRY